MLLSALTADALLLLIGLGLVLAGKPYPKVVEGSSQIAFVATNDFLC